MDDHCQWTTNYSQVLHTTFSAFAHSICIVCFSKFTFQINNKQAVIYNRFVGIVVDVYSVIIYSAFIQLGCKMHPLIQLTCVCDVWSDLFFLYK